VIVRMITPEVATRVVAFCHSDVPLGVAKLVWTS
jgi:hypothetical protein